MHLYLDAISQAKTNAICSKTPRKNDSIRFRTLPSDIVTDKMKRTQGGNEVAHLQRDAILQERPSAEKINRNDSTRFQTPAHNATDTPDATWHSFYRMERIVPHQDGRVASSLRFGRTAIRLVLGNVFHQTVSTLRL